MALIVLVVACAAIGVWFARRRPGVPHDFAALLERPEFVDDPGNSLHRRTAVQGEFRGRHVAIVLEQRHRSFSPVIIVSMATRAAMSIKTYEFAGYRAGREGELALFALEVNHAMTLTHENGSLTAQWGGSLHALVGFWNQLDAAKWRSILEAMDTLTGSIEQRETDRAAATPAQDSA
jgi:hypothetical protein